jgi:hypothetical protein
MASSVSASEAIFSSIFLLMSEVAAFIQSRVYPAESREQSHAS